jgi:hypothetical protein
VCGDWNNKKREEERRRRERERERERERSKVRRDSMKERDAKLASSVVASKFYELE